MKKQYFNFWVGLICLLAFFSANVYGFESEGFYFDVISEDDLTVKLSLVKYSDDLERVDIPATVSHEGKTYNVTVIDSTAFQNCYSTSVISIPETVTHIRFGSGIGSRPFNNCDVLTEISVAENNPQYSSFDGALYDKGQTVLLQFPKAKSSVSFPEAITTIGNYAFARCKGFTVMNIPKTVTTIGSYAFNNCERLTSITIPNSVTKIEDGAFARCAALTAIAVPESVTIIKDNTFAYCENLVSIDLPKSITEIEKSAFEYCRHLASISTPNSVISIGDYAFRGCSALTSIRIPESVTTIGAGIVTGCTNLTEIQVEAGNPAYSAVDNILYDKEQTTLIQCLPSKTSVSLPATVTVIGSSAFNNCTGLTSITLPQSLTTIGDRAFIICIYNHRTTKTNQKYPSVNL